MRKVKQQFPKIKYTSTPRSIFNKRNGMDIVSNLCLPNLNGILLILQNRWNHLDWKNVIHEWVFWVHISEFFPPLVPIPNPEWFGSVQKINGPISPTCVPHFFVRKCNYFLYICKIWFHSAGCQSTVYVIWNYVFWVSHETIKNNYVWFHLKLLCKMSFFFSRHDEFVG